MASLFESCQASICSMKSVPLLPECPCVQRSSAAIRQVWAELQEHHRVVSIPASSAHSSHLQCFLKRKRLSSALKSAVSVIKGVFVLAVFSRLEYVPRVQYVWNDSL